MTHHASLHGCGVGILARQPLVLYSAALCALMVATFLWWPIRVTDTDLWYHLDYGRYIVHHWAVPRQTFFSFLEPPRDLVDYSWLFQVLVYGLHAIAGYPGLILLRSGLYLVTAALIFRYLFRAWGSRSLAWPTFIGVLVSMALLPRYYNVRPHMITYLAILASLYLLEHHPRRARYLPVLAVLWCNFHGITYPILLLIAGAYALEYFLGRLQGGRDGPTRERTFLVPVVASMLAIFLTPNGLRLLELSPRPLEYLATFIGELRPVTLGMLLSFDAPLMRPSHQTVFNVLLFTAGLVAVTTVLRRRARPAHVVLYLGGLALLTNGVRFMYESVLLWLPLLAANAPRMMTQGRTARRRPSPAAALLAAALLLIPGWTLVSFWQDARPRYPFSHTNLPQGIVTFLNRLEARGAVLNDSNIGGYLRWALDSRFRIFMDNEMYFTDEDFYLARQVFADQAALRKVLDRYDPPLIAAPLWAQGFPELIQAFPDYVLVFVDDVGALYVNARQHPAIARQHALTALQPFRLAARGEEALRDLRDDQIPLIVNELAALLAVYPDGFLANSLAAAIALRQGAHQQALGHAETIIQHFPESALGWRLHGDALRGLDRPDRAAASYRAALRRTGAALRQDVYRRLGLAYQEAHRYPQAYGALKRSVDFFARETTVDDLYRLGSVARLVGSEQEARWFFTYLQDAKLTPEDTEWRRKVQAELAQLGGGPHGP